MAATAIQHCNRALRLAGGRQIASLSDGISESDTANDLYEPVVTGLLAQRRWRFATSEYVLTVDGTAPETHWTYRYQLPASTLVIHGVYVNGVSVPFDRYGNYIHCDIDANSELVLDRTERVDESIWPNYFDLVVMWELAAAFASALSRDGDLVKSMEDKGQIHFFRAINVDQQGRTAPRVRLSRFAERRRSRSSERYY